MRESGAGSLDKWVVLLPIVVLIGVTMVLAGGPRDLLETLTTDLTAVFTAVWDWVADFF